MFAARDQENLVNAHQTTAANKPLNQSMRALHPKTPGNNLKTPFASRNDENRLLGANKADKNLFITPAPRNRAPLGAKTTNAKAQPFKTPAPGQKPPKQEQTLRKASTGRRSAKSRIVVAPSEPVQSEVLQTKEVEEHDDEPDYGYAPPPIVPLADPPLDIDYDDTYPQFQGENYFKGWQQIYLASPKDEDGVSLRLKKEEEYERQAIEWQEKELKKAMEFGENYKLPDPDEQVEAIIASRPALKLKGQNKTQQSKVNEAKLNTLKARSAAIALSDVSQRNAGNSKLPSAALRETSSSKQKRKPLFSVNRDIMAADSKTLPLRSAPPPVSRTTIGFPKAKKAPSILPSPERVRSKAPSHSAPQKQQTQIDPLEFVDLYGEPPAESEIWFRLQERRRQRKNENANADDLAEGLFEMEIDDDLDRNLRIGLDDFELPMPVDE